MQYLKLLLLLERIVKGIGKAAPIISAWYQRRKKKKAAKKLRKAIQKARKQKDTSDLENLFKR